MGLVWQLPALVSLALVVGVPLLAWLGVLGPNSFFTFLIGVAIAAIATIGFGAAGAFASATGRPWRSRAVRAGLIPLVLTLAVVAPTLLRGQHPIHDVTTDANDQLQFTPDVAALEQAPMPREQVLELQREYYPDLAPLYVNAKPDSVYASALEAAKQMDRWEIVTTDPRRRRIEATATSRIFGFVDDVVIEVRRDPEGSRVEARSRSRMGQSDLGANAARIRRYFGQVLEQL